MSARYEISEGELDVLAITGPEGTRYIDGEEIEARAIRQQSADIAELRAELAAAVAERDMLSELAQRRERQLSVALNEVETLRAFKQAIDSAPVVAVVREMKRDFASGPYKFLYYDSDNLPAGGTELVARPAKD